MPMNQLNLQLETSTFGFMWLIYRVKNVVFIAMLSDQLFLCNLRKTNIVLRNPAQVGMFYTNLGGISKDKISFSQITQK